MSAFFHTFLYEPIYNLLVFFLSFVPHGDVGLAIVLVTIIIRFIVMPFSLAALRTQRAMQEMQPKIKEIKELYKNDKERLAKETFALYREHHINPLAGLAPLFIQIPILIGLYWVFNTEHISVINSAILYPFVSVPDTTSVLFLGLFSLTESSVILALLAAGIQFWNGHRTIPPPAAKKDGKQSMQEDFGRMMSLQMRYVIPVFIGIAAYTSGAIALYLITSGLFGIGESYLRKKPLPLPETVLS